MPIYINGERYRPYIDGVEVNVLIGGEYYHQVKRIRTITETIVGTNLRIDSNTDQAYCTLKFSHKPIDITAATLYTSQETNSMSAKIWDTRYTTAEWLSKASTSGTEVYIGYYTDNSAGSHMPKDERIKTYMQSYYRKTTLTVTYTYMG